MEPSTRALRFSADGVGQPLVMIHSYPLDHRMWAGQDPLARYARLIRFDLPGFGGLPPPATPSVAAWADHVIRVMNAAGCAKACICGRARTVHRNPPGGWLTPVRGLRGV